MLMIKSEVADRLVHCLVYREHRLNGVDQLGGGDVDQLGGGDQVVASPKPTRTTLPPLAIIASSADREKWLA